MRRRGEDEKRWGEIPEKLRRFRREEWPEGLPDPEYGKWGVPYYPENQFWDARWQFEEDAGVGLWDIFPMNDPSWPSLPWDDRRI